MEKMLAELLALCQTQPIPDSKFEEFLVQLEELQKNGYHKVMVFSNFRNTQVWLRKQLAQRSNAYQLAGLFDIKDWI